LQSQAVPEGHNVWPWGQRHYDPSNPRRLQCSATLLWDPPVFSNTAVRSSSVQQHCCEIPQCSAILLRDPPVFSNTAARSSSVQQHCCEILQCSATLLWDPPISQHIIYPCHIPNNTNSISVGVSKHLTTSLQIIWDIFQQVYASHNIPTKPSALQCEGHTATSLVTHFPVFPRNVIPSPLRVQGVLLQDERSSTILQNITLRHSILWNAARTSAQRNSQTVATLFGP
jgi:hypothetical protein